MPRFGEPRGPVTDRPGAYGVVVDERWRVAVVRVEDGAHHLPGGGLEPGETPLDALHRELAEETGLTVEVVAALGVASQYVHAADRCWHKIGHFFVCRPLAAGLPTAPDHALEWWGSTRALRDLAHPYYAWAVRKALGPC